MRDRDAVMPEKTLSVRDLDRCPCGLGSWRAGTTGVGGREIGAGHELSVAGEGARGDGMIIVVLC